MLPLHETLSYYKRHDIQKAIVDQCKRREVAVKFNDQFGKRPEVLIHPKDVLSFAQQKASSFHISEELWSDPMQLSTGMNRGELDQLRTGFDLVLDVDFPDWDASKLITHALISQLKQDGIPENVISLKFSGNKGFHIGVPFEVFPDTYTTDDGEDLLMSDLFPDGVKKIVEYLVDSIDSVDNKFRLSKDIEELIGPVDDKLKVTVCIGCGKKRANVVIEGSEFICANCGFYTRSEQSHLSCEKCGKFMERKDFDFDVCDCGETRTASKIDLAIDTMLVSSRHMFRAAYSLHEKSGLVSLPIAINNLKNFEKSSAKPDNVQTELVFLSRDVDKGSGFKLLQKAFRHKPLQEEEKKSFADVEWSGEAAPEELFPPAIKKMLGPLRDGKKRALFVLTNFLKSVGWSEEMIEARLREWNQSHPEPLRETVLVSHLRYHSRKGNVLPPNFDNDMYYQDIGVLEHDELSKRIKNPVQYVRLKAKRKKD